MFSLLPFLLILSCLFPVAVASTSVRDGELHLLQYSFLKITPVSVPCATFKAPFQEVSFISQENVHVRIVTFVLVIPCATAGARTRSE